MRYKYGQITNNGRCNQISAGKGWQYVIQNVYGGN